MDLQRGNFTKEDIEGNKVAAVISYISFLVVITLLIAPDSKFARYHANQGVTLLIVSVVFGIARGIILGIFGFIPLVGAIIGFILSIINLLIVILSILGIVNAVKGEAKPLPIIGSFTLLK